MSLPGHVALGRVIGAFGIQGWIKLQSYTRPQGGILEYKHWRLDDRTWSVVEGHPQGNTVVAQLKGLDDRDVALALRGKEIEVERTALPPAEPGEFYWADLVGCKVVNVAGAALGTVQTLLENGPQDVLVVQGERERLIPFVAGPIVKYVDLASRTILLDWELDY